MAPATLNMFTLKCPDSFSLQCGAMKQPWIAQPALVSLCTIRVITLEAVVSVILSLNLDGGR